MIVPNTKCLCCYNMRVVTKCDSLCVSYQLIMLNNVQHAFESTLIDLTMNFMQSLLVKALSVISFGNCLQSKLERYVLVSIGVEVEDA